MDGVPDGADGGPDSLAGRPDAISAMAAIARGERLARRLQRLHAFMDGRVERPLTEESATEEFRRARRDDRVRRELRWLRAQVPDGIDPAAAVERIDPALRSSMNALIGRRA